MDRKDCLTFYLKSKEMFKMYKEIFFRLKILILFGR